MVVTLRSSVLTVALCLAASMSAQAQIYTPQWKVGGAINGIEKPGKFSSVVGVTLDNKGCVYVAGQSSVQKFDPSGKFLFKFGETGAGNGQFSPRQGMGMGGAIAVDSVGNVYVSDWGNRRIQKFSPNGTFLSSFGTRGSGNGQFEQPNALALDHEDNLFVLDTTNRCVQKFDKAGRFLSCVNSSAIANPPIGSYKPDWIPTSIAVDAKDNLYVAYAARIDDGVIRKFSAGGKSLASFTGFSNDTCITTDIKGNLYVLDTTGCRARIFNSKGVLQSKFTAREQVNVWPSGIAVDKKGDIYIGGHGNGIAYVRKFRQRYLVP